MVGRSGRLIGAAPKDRRFTCEPVNLSVDASSSCLNGGGGGAMLGRFLALRTVTLGDKLWLSRSNSGMGLGEALNGDALPGGGNFDRTECTRSSIFCILPIRPLIWYSEPDLARGSAGCRLCLGGGGPIRVLVPASELVADVIEGPRECWDTLAG